ncbi:serine/threonine-protein kinase [Streptomyces qinglanensis]|uniref:PQQ-like domain-containing protein n=1 Tax=Streptomyces qinglanensis TaxID=943816 RepID=A0A1H9WKQ2_9ACTN|nr:serine/threonine-protein kinase [Streptomyces qinglanensis]SES34411.1 PQQ-like domain-containing protein [Streptomyces qinglanensis]
MTPLGTGDPIRLGPYRLLGVLGEGGMGKVYLGVDRTGTAAAVKVLRPEVVDEADLNRRFIREAQAARAVTSTGVAAVLGAQTEGGRLWIATEFLAGPTLEQAVEAHGPFEERAVRAIAASIARTLCDIHAAGLIHRDLKPANIVLTSNGPRIIDFGIARPQHGLTLTPTGQVPITPGYSAPEQALGHRVTPAVDVFSLGAVLVQTAGGRPPFDATNIAALLYKVVHDEPDLSTVPEALLPLITPLLAKEPTARPAPAGIAVACAPPRGAERCWRRGPLAEEIKKRESHVRALTAPGPSEADRGLSRRRMVTGLAGGGTLLAAGGGAAFTLWSRERSEAKEKDLFAFPPAARTPKAKVLDRDDGDFVVGGSPKALWGPLYIAEGTPAVLPVRDVLVFGHRDGGIAACNVVDGKQRWVHRDIRPKSRYLSLSDRLIAAVDEAGTLRTFIAATGEPRWSAPVGASALLAADEDTVYLRTKDHRLCAVARSNARVRWSRKFPEGFNGTLAPPGAAAHERLVVSTDKGDILAFDTTDGRLVWKVRKQWDSLVRPAIRKSIVLLNGTTLTARRLQDGKELWTIRDKTSYDRPFSPATITDDETVYAVNEPLLFKLRSTDGSKIWSGRGMVSGGLPTLVQGNGVWGIDTELEGEVITVDKTDGSILWRYDIPLAQNAWQVADGNRVFIMTDRSVYALPVC